LYTVLEALCRLAAPLLPLVTERVWQGLTGGRSVHLPDRPTASEFPVDSDLVATMDRVREVTSTALALRKQAGLAARLAPAELGVVAPSAALLEPYAGILADELNVKRVAFAEFDEATAAEYGISHRLSVNARAAGPRLGKTVQSV